MQFAAINDAHRQSAVHRDLKSAILISTHAVRGSGWLLSLLRRRCRFASRPNGSRHRKRRQHSGKRTRIEFGYVHLRRGHARKRNRRGGQCGHRHSQGASTRLGGRSSCQVVLCGYARQRGCLGELVRSNRPNFGAAGRILECFLRAKSHRR